MGRIDAIWLATEPTDMRAGTETALAQRDLVPEGSVIAKALGRTDSIYRGRGSAHR